jgi:hypothetical protein
MLKLPKVPHVDEDSAHSQPQNIFWEDRKPETGCRGLPLINAEGAIR